MTGFHLGDVENYNNLESVVGFSIDKTVSDALNPYVQATETQCILTKTLADTDKAGIVRFILNFKEGVTTIKCSKNVRSITILDSPSKEVESVGALSDAGLFNRPNSDRQKRNLKEDNFDEFFASKLDREIDDHYEKVKEDNPEPSDEIIPLKTSTAKMDTSISNKIDKLVEKDPKTPIDVSAKTSPVPKTTQVPALDSCEDNKIPLKMDKNGYFETSFVIYISDVKLEGLYSMFFHNCFNYLHHSNAERKAVDFTILI